MVLKGRGPASLEAGGSSGLGSESSWTSKKNLLKQAGEGIYLAYLTIRKANYVRLTR